MSGDCLDRAREHHQRKGCELLLEMKGFYEQMKAARDGIREWQDLVTLQPHKELEQARQDKAASATHQLGCRPPCTAQEKMEKDLRAATARPEDVLHVRVLRCTPGGGLGSDGVDGGQSNHQCFRSIETNRCAVSAAQKKVKKLEATLPSSSEMALCDWTQAAAAQSSSPQAQRARAPNTLPKSRPKPTSD